MIVFDLKCRKNHVFEGWFADSATFQAQADAGEVACPVCGDSRITKALMAPNVATRSSSAKGQEVTPMSGSSTLAMAQQKEQAAQLLAMMRAAKDHVEKNFEHVGPRFAEEARKIHYKETEARGIYGEATGDEAKALAEEGVEFHPLPVLPEDRN
jgi:hypothetical protein